MSVVVNSSSDLLGRTLSAPTLTQFTLCTWIKVIASTGGYTSYLNIGSASGRAFLGTNSGGSRLMIYTAGGTTPDASYDYPIGTWLHLAFTLTGSTWSAYINGVLEDQQSSFNAITGTYYGIGIDSGGSWPANAAFRGFRVWDNVALSAAELTSEMNSTTPVRTSGLYGAYDLANAATAATDSSGNSRTLTVANLSDGADDPAIYGAASATSLIAARRPNRLRTFSHF